MERIYHTWEKWECFPAGFHNNQPSNGMSKEDCENKYKELLSDLDAFEFCLAGVIAEWPNSCEHNLSNECMNRVAWLGQASLCWRYGIPATFRGGYNLLAPEQQSAADSMALKYLNRWLESHGEDQLDEETSRSKTVQNKY